MDWLLQAKFNVTSHNQQGVGHCSICLSKEHEKEKKNPQQKFCHKKGHEKKHLQSLGWKERWWKRHSILLHHHIILQVMPDYSYKDEREQVSHGWGKRGKRGHIPEGAANWMGLLEILWENLPLWFSSEPPWQENYGMTSTWGRKDSISPGLTGATASEWHREPSIPGG